MLGWILGGAALGLNGYAEFSGRRLGREILAGQEARELALAEVRRHYGITGEITADQRMAAHRWVRVAEDLRQARPRSAADAVVLERQFETRMADIERFCLEMAAREGDPELRPRLYHRTPAAEMPEPSSEAISYRDLRRPTSWA